MNAGQETKMLRGAIWACVIPVGIGLSGLLLVLLSLRNDRSLEDVWLAFWPATFFLFGFPLAAWTACRSLAKINSLIKISLWRSSALRWILSVSGVQLGLTAIYIIVIAALTYHLQISATDGDWFPPPTEDTMSIVILGTTILTLAFWAIITLPLSLICASIFWRVTKFPEDTSVF